MRRLLAFVLAAGLVIPQAGGASREDLVVDDSSAASGTVPAFRTAGYTVNHFQVCGTGFSGVVTALQGAKSTTTTATKVATISGLTGCSEYYLLNPSAWTGYSWTRSAGSFSLYRELAP